MASIFTYQEEPHRVHSPWSTPGSNTPQIAVHVHGQTTDEGLKNGDFGKVTKLEPEKHDGPIEYKLHLLLRWRRPFTYCSTAVSAWANQQARLESASAVSPASTDAALSRSTYQPSTHNRQARLQQLTTQLLWRLQQSSPFHSSSNAKLVLPVLPEATPRLGMPDRPSKLLPGLEESQGALYEIGVADDGTLVGLADEEMEESLINLRAMAASLGCVVDVHRRVIVGDCEWLEGSPNENPPLSRTSKLWVAEVLVRPDNKSVEIVPTDTAEALQTLDAESLTQHEKSGFEIDRQHLRIALVGSSAAGKSSLLGTLTTSALDNGRGKSRLSLLKHRHEIASGVTSSVAQELLGYRDLTSRKGIVVNYATGDVSSWPDIHNLAARLVFLSDSPGLPRYSKSTFRALFSWNPAWTILCIPADDAMQDSSFGPGPDFNRTGDTRPVIEEPNLSLTHLDLCLKVERPFIIAITKMDMATKSGLRCVLGQILSMIKAVGKSPLLINAPSTQSQRRDDVDFSSKIDELIFHDQDQITGKLSCFDAGEPSKFVPIIMTSAVSGSGIASLHALLRALPVALPKPVTVMTTTMVNTKMMFYIDEVFAIPPSKVYSTSAQRAVNSGGVVLCGVVDSGTIALGDTLLLGPFVSESESMESLHVRALRRTSSHQNKALSHSLPRSFSETFSKSLQINGRSQTDYESETKSLFVKVCVVSLRNLRLPVTSMRAGDTGTVGIQVLDDNDASSAFSLHKARKGMILTHSREHLQGYSSFTASFPYSDFGGTGSPPLILGGHAIAYINSIRAAIKVTAVALEDQNSQQNGSSTKQRSPVDEVFSFDDDEDEGLLDVPNSTRTENLRISFRFVSTIEYLELNDQILVVPNVTATGPVTGPSSTSSIPGFSGFVGRICGMRT